MITTRLTHLFIEGICDDAGTPPCDGRLTTMDQECLDTDKGIKTAGPIVSNTSRGQFRSCFDNMAMSDCTGSSPAAIIISEGESRAQVRQIKPDTPNVPDGGNVELVLEKTTEFIIDGKTRELEFEVIVGDFMLEPDTNMNNCGGTGCGVAATFVSSDDDSSDDDSSNDD